MIEPNKGTARVTEVQKSFSDIVKIFSGIGYTRSFTLFTNVAGCLLKIDEAVEFWYKNTRRGYKALGLRGQACNACPFAMNGCKAYYQGKTE